MSLISQVTDIMWQCPNSKSTVRLLNGTTYSAKAVLVTVPLGVLKAGEIKFQPSLPMAKSNAISKLGFGCLNKVFLTWASPWWLRSIGNLNIIWDHTGTSMDQIKTTSSLYENVSRSISFNFNT